MKSTLILMLFLSSATMLRGQIINGDFEQGLDGWKVGRATNDLLIRTDDPHFGKFGFHFSTYTGRPSLIIGNSEPGANIPKSTNAVSFWYRAAFRSDSTVIFLDGSSNSYSGAKPVLLSPKSVWTKHTIMFNTTVEKDSSDHFNFGFYFENPYNLTNGVDFSLDDISFDTVVTSIPILKTVNLNFSISPNPISSHAHLKLHLDATASIRAAIYDVTGREVMRLPELAAASGDESIPFDVDEIPNGMYYVRCEVGGNVTMLKVIVQH